MKFMHMMIRKLFPGGNAKAFNVSFDDGVYQDIRFVELLNRYGLKGTFNINSGLMKQGFEWTHECGMTVKRLPEDVVKELYRGHEVASHTFSHPYMDHYSKTDILRELASDRFFLEQIFDREVTGYATPFYYYSDLVASCVKECGFSYARISEESNDYSIPEDFYRWRGSKFHWDQDLEDFIQGFLQTDQELALCQLVGHSYDLDVMDLWDRTESVFCRIASAGDLLAATHFELVQYLRAMECARISAGEIVNESELPLWFCVDGETVSIQPGCKMTID